MASPALPNLDNGDIAKQAANGAATVGAIIAAFAAKGSALALAGPIGAAVAVLTTVGVLIASKFQGCGQTCVTASKDADLIEGYIQQGNTAYFSLPQRYRSFQLAQLTNIDTALTALGRACGDPALGDAGRRCVSERLVRGGTAPWCPKPGHTGCDWITLYRDPIANDPGVLPDPDNALSIGASGVGISAGGNFLDVTKWDSTSILIGVLAVLVIIKKMRAG